eukprot:gene37559-65619_t
MCTIPPTPWDGYNAAWELWLGGDAAGARGGIDAATPEARRVGRAGGAHMAEHCC